MSLAGAPGGPSALPVQLTVAQTYRHVVGNLPAFAYLGALPIVVRFGAEMFVLLALAAPPSPLAQIALLLLSTMLLATFAVAWQRFTLLGEIGRRGPWQFVFERRDALFFLTFLLLTAPALLAMQVMLTQQQEPSMLPPILMGVAFFLFVRLALVLPAIALDGEIDLRRAWQLSQGQFWRLAAVLLLVTLPIEMLSLLLLLTLSGEALLSQFLTHTAGVLLEFLIFAITMTALAYSYRWLAGPPAPANDAGGTRAA